MAALKPAPGVAKIVITGLAGTSSVQHVQHAAMSISPRAWTLAELQSLANRVQVEYITHFLPLLSQAFSYQRVDVMDLISETGLEAAATGPAPGTSPGSDTLPVSVAMCITWNIANRYRGGHPRTYLAALNQSRLGTLTSWDPTFVTGAQLAAEAYLDAINQLVVGGQPVRLGHLARFRNKIELVEPIFIQWDSAKVDGRVDSQRRRLGPDVP